MNKTYLKLSLDLDFILVAITAPMKDYMFCHKLNTSLSLNFEKVADHEVFFNIDEPPVLFSKYYHVAEEGETEFYIVSNRNSEGFLIPEMNKVDFFMVIHQFIDQEDLNYIISGLNKLADIQVAVQIEPARLKSKQNLIM
ncbi:MULTISPECIES: IPExxxVDY family protein [Pedobacter]|uniref:IPExxxVDY family protein n=1 Tax=Pedobacter TaxID=84567 RepID=UPI00210D91F1|nr:MULTISPECIES: IPExxxVDY family protein [unclassified Pedobacter]